MSKLAPLIAGITGTVVIGGAGGYLVSTQRPPTIRDSFKDGIIDFDKETELVKGKLTLLKDPKTNPTNKKLISAKAKETAKTNDGLNDFKAGCKEIYDSSFSSKNASLFAEFKAFCSRNIKDKIGKDKWYKDSAPKWEDRFKKLSQDGTKPLSESLNKVSKATENKEKHLQEWCNSIADEVFEGEENLEFKDAKLHCGPTP